MEATDVLAFYASHSPMTDPGKMGALIEPLPNDVAALARIIQGVGIYDVVARDFYGFEPPKDRLAEIHLRSIAERLARIMELDDRPLHNARDSDRRALQRCNSFALLLVAMLRAKGAPARSRCGFAAYFNPPNFEDHWVCEYWDAQDRRWRLADPQIDDVWRTRLNIRFDTLDLPRAQFLSAGEAWRRCRSGEADERRFGISFAGLRGLWFVAGSLVRDVAALNKMEMAPWDVWGAQPGQEGEFDFAYFDDLAALTRNPDDAFAQLRQRYEDDIDLRVPPKVFNALNQRHEAIDGPTDSPRRNARGAEPRHADVDIRP
ncbi:MAG: transglutaminase domain-containing protein [Hyphomicrobiales bacterium]|nr:transglutaminase domain-containing protein [Hyphomicrobiales bacterium]